MGFPAPNLFSHRFCGAYNFHRNFQWNFQWKKKVSDGLIINILYVAFLLVTLSHVSALNKDILHKLLTIMWTDYSESVRSVAAETVGVKGHGNVSGGHRCEGAWKRK